MLSLIAWALLYLYKIISTITIGVLGLNYSPIEITIIKDIGAHVVVRNVTWKRMGKFTKRMLEYKGTTMFLSKER